MYRIFRCITHYFLIFERPGAGYITNAGCTFLKSKIERLVEIFFIIMVKFLLPYMRLNAGWSLGHVEIAATGGGWPLHMHIPHSHS